MGVLTWGCEGPSQEASTRPGRILGRRSRWKYHKRFQKMMGWAEGNSGNASTSLPSFSTSDSSSLRSTRGLRYAHAPLSTRREGPYQAQRGRAVEGMYIPRALPPTKPPHPTASGMPLALKGKRCAHLFLAPHRPTIPFLMPLWPSSYPHVPVAELGLIQSKAEPAVTEHRPRTPRDRSIFAATGISRLGAGDTAGGQQQGSALGPSPPYPTHSTCPALGTWAGNQGSGH